MLSRKYYIMIARVIKKNTIINDDDMLPHNKVNKISLIADFMRELHKDNFICNPFPLEVYKTNLYYNMNPKSNQIATPRGATMGGSSHKEIPTHILMLFFEITT